MKHIGAKIGLAVTAFTLIVCVAAMLVLDKSLAVQDTAGSGIGASSATNADVAFEDREDTAPSG